MRFSYLLVALTSVAWIACGCSATPQPEDDRISPTSAAWAGAVVLSPGIFRLAVEDTVWEHNGMEGPGAADWRAQYDFDGNRAQHDEHVVIFRSQSHEVDDILTAFIWKPPEMMGQPAGEAPPEAPPRAVEDSEE
jgi:hypothetical protein